MFISVRSTVLLLAITALSSSAAADIHYVRRDAGGGGDGASWATAFSTVQEALAVARSGDQIWVGKGTYRPGTGASSPSAHFEIPLSVSVYGGFFGNETLLSQRDWVANKTYLSGDLFLDDGPDFANRDDNCYHVVRVTAAKNQLVTIDGFTIRGGHAVGLDDDSRGAGICNLGSFLEIRHCVLAENDAVNVGGGVYTIDGFTRFYESTIRGNHALGGAGVYFFGDGSMTGCLIEGNIATSPAGPAAATVQDGSVDFSNVAVAYNEGGGLQTCCVFNNSSLRNSIVWGNSGTQYQDFAGGVAQFTVIQGGTSGGLDLDPLWVDPLGPDGVAGTGDEDYRLSCMSPLIDHGSNNFIAGALVDLAGNPRRLDDPATPDLGAGTAPIVDLGPYEFVCGCDQATNYCTALPNTSGTPASISWSGSTSIFANDLTLLVTGGPPLKNGIFYYGPLQAFVPWGDGIRCVGGALQRLTVVHLDANGAGSFPLDFTHPPVGSGPHALLAGHTANFQFYFRDPSGGPAGWNYSDALRVVFCR